MTQANTSTDNPPQVSIQSRLLGPSLLIPALTLLALTLRLYKIGYYEYFDDEVISIFAARLPITDLLRSVSDSSVHPPLYYMLLHLWRFFGEELTTIRLLSALTSSACVPLVYLLGREVASRSAALVAAALMAFSPFHIYHGQQARMYPLLALIITAMALLFLRAWRLGGWHRWLWFAGICALGFYTHVYFPFSLLALDIWALFDTLQSRFEKKRWLGLIAAQALGLLPFLPFLPQLFGTVQGVVQVFWIQNGPLDWMFDLISLSNFGTVIALGTSVPPGLQWQALAMYLPAVMALVLVFIYSLRQARRDPGTRPAWVFLHLLIWTPIVIATTVSLTLKPILVDRYLLGISSALYVLMAWTFVRFWRARVAQFTALAYVASLIASLTYVYPNAPAPNDLVRLANYIAAEYRPGDAIALADWQSLETTVLTHPEQPDIYVLPGPHFDTTNWIRRITGMQWGGPQNIQSVPDFAPRYKRVWLVFTLQTYDVEYLQQHNQKWLDQHGRLVQTLTFERAFVWLYELETP